MFGNRFATVVVACLLIVAGAATVFFVTPTVETADQTMVHRVVEQIAEASTTPQIAPHLPMPRMVKGVYATARSVQYTKRFTQLLALLDRSELNTLVIDVKDGNGALAFLPKDQSLQFATSTIFLPPLEELTSDLHARGIYTIARIFVFEDPWLATHSSSTALRRADGAPWQDKKGIQWTDPADETVWQYDVAIAREVWQRGFDEVQFDYIRFPTDGDVKNIQYPVWDGIEQKRSVIRRFFSFLHDELVAKGIPVSVDLFGYTVRLDESDLGIGQHTKDALPFVTAISPMVYPSHYYPGSYGFAKPAEHPGEIVAKSMEIANILAASSTSPHATFRPWLQDFDIGAVYDAPKIRAQIDAAEKGGASGWLIWNARNVYTEDAFLSSSTERQ